jgi:amidohydrolase
MDLDELKALARQEVERIAPELIAISDWMADNPELGYQEHRATERLTALLQEFGAEVDRGIAGLPTAFEARLWPAQSGPKVAIIAEYDALPDVGHGCGHNIIATAAAGAGVALARLAGKLPGAAVVLGTPAEESAVEGAGGKIPVLNAGHFAGVDAAIMIHPWRADGISMRSSLVAYGLEFAFHGRAAHAAANPHEGINALDALIVLFNSVGLLRQQVRSDARIHGVITYGGGAPNVIPPYAACRFRVRATDAIYAKELVQRVIGCAEAGAQATGARLEWREYAHPYLNMVPNATVAGAFRDNLTALGRTLVERDEGEGMGSTDFGNVSQVVPAVHAFLGICGKEAGWHTKEVAEATRTERGHAAIIAGAQSMAMTVIDLLMRPELVAAAHAEHEAAMRPVREGLAQLDSR